jgi:prephenate dehydrogenase
MFDKITVLGVGLIGASFALAAKKNGLCGHVAGFGRNRQNLEAALKRGIIDSFEQDASAACKDADLVMLSTPVGSFRDLVPQISPSLKKGAILTDAGSVKGELVYALEKIAPEGVHFIGAHPISGSEQSGIDAADAELFRKARCIVTPTENSHPESREKIVRLWERLGSRVELMDPFRHDRIYAAVSHLPHLVAYALVNTVNEVDDRCMEYAGQGFRDTTRIAASSHEIWRDICLMNRENLVEMLEVFRENMAALGRYLRASDSDSLEREFKKARTLREDIGQG